MNDLELNFKTVFVDIDSTLTDSKTGQTPRSHMDLFTDLVAQKNKISRAKAFLCIKSAEDSVKDMVGYYWPFNILAGLGVRKMELWKVLLEDAKKNIFVHQDAKIFLMELKQHLPDAKIYTATTNPQLIIYSKLAVAGLANQYGSPYIDGAFGGEEIYPGGKSCPGFYKNLLKRTGAAPETTLMIGDSPEMDLSLAKAAGIKQVVLVRREQNKEWVREADGGIYVKRLDVIFKLINSKKKSECFAE